MEPKFKEGDKVRVVKDSPMIWNDGKGNVKEISLNPEVVGKEAVVVGSYFELYCHPAYNGSNVEHFKQSYKLTGLNKVAWYDEDELEKI